MREPTNTVQNFGIGPGTVSPFQSRGLFTKMARFLLNMDNSAFCNLHECEVTDVERKLSLLEKIFCPWGNGMLEFGSPVLKVSSQLSLFIMLPSVWMVG